MSIVTKCQKNRERSKTLNNLKHYLKQTKTTNILKRNFFSQNWKKESLQNMLCVLSNGLPVDLSLVMTT